MHLTNRSSRRLAIVSLAVAGLFGGPVALAAEPAAPATAPAGNVGFSEALQLTRPGAPTTAPANVDAALMDGVTIPPAPSSQDANDPSIAAASAAYRKMFNNAREAGVRVSQADMGDYVDRVLAQWTLSNLSLAQLDKIITALPTVFAPKTKPAIDAILVEKAKGSDADAAQAALLRLQLMPFNTPDDARKTMISQVLAHPGLPAAIARGNGDALFTAAANLKAPEVKGLAQQFDALAPAIKPDAPIGFYDTAARFQLAIAHTLEPADLAAFEPFRSAAANAANQRLNAGNLPKEEQARLQTAVQQLNGAFARGQLIGHPAPPIDFIAFNDPSDPSRKLTSLADLKGKVVLVDFWATWCGPCVAAFPKIKAVSRYYTGFDVVVLGVTSPQGFVSLASGRVDTSDDPANEANLIFTQFAKEKDMTWPIAVAKQSVFNPEYGITGIPCFVIIDAAGKVRHLEVGYNPNSTIDEKIALIDPLLAEAGLPLPARMMMSKPPAH